MYRKINRAAITLAVRTPAYNPEKKSVHVRNTMLFTRSRLWLAAASIALAIGVAVAVIHFADGRPARAPGRKTRGANILLVTLDTTRADHIGCYGYRDAETPVLDAFAAEGLRFENCITPTAYTLPSHASIMTGLYPPAHGVRINGEAALAASNTTLAEQLAAKGYRTGAFVGAFVLDGRWGLSQGFQTYDDHFRLGANQRLDLAGVRRPANEVVDAAMKWLETPDPKPFFAWIHLYDAHAPYQPPEPFRSRFASRGEKGLYDGGIAFADSQVGRLLQWLDGRGLKEKTIVVIVGDHGEGLGDHGENEHGYYIYDYAVRVPLLARIPGTSPRNAAIPAQVRTIDIAPTLLELTGTAPMPRVEGRSLLAAVDGRESEPRYAYSESMVTNLQYGWSALYGLRTNDYKFIEAPRSELYDVRSDPKELRNTLDSNRRVARQYKDDLARIRAESARDAPNVEEANLDQETMKKLASLGYVGGASAKLREGPGLADPKDKMHLFDSVGYAAHLISIDDHKQAAQVLEIVLHDDPKVPQALILLATTYRKLGKSDRAKAILDAYLREDPGNVRALIGMAEILLEEGKNDDVVAICRRALAADERNARAYELMADISMAQNDHKAALPLLRKVVEIQPKLNRSRNNLAACLIATGQPAEAETLLKDILAEYPKFPLANYHLGLLREAQGRPGDARAAYEKELENHPKEEVARFNLGDLLLRNGDTAGAEKQMRILIEEKAAGPRPYLLLARILLNDPRRLGEVEKLALAGLDRAKEPDLKALGYFLLADVYSREGRRNELAQALRMGEYYRAQIGKS